MLHRALLSFLRLGVLLCVIQLGGFSAMLVDVLVERDTCCEQSACPCEPEREGTSCPTGCAMCNAHVSLPSLPPSCTVQVPLAASRELTNTTVPYSLGVSPRSDPSSLYRPPRV